MRNPAYNGKWVPPKKLNPNYIPITKPFLLDGFVGAIGIEILAINEGILLDNFLISDSDEDATREYEKIKRAKTMNDLTFS